MKRVCFILLVSGAAAIIILLLFLSPLTKYLIERYDEQYTGRQITLDRAYVNPFTGFFAFSNFKVLEKEKDTVFFSAKEVSIDLALLKLLSKTYEITEVIFKEPRGTVVQNKKQLNFDDLIRRFSRDTLKPSKAPARINILRIAVEHGEFYYHEKVIPIRYVIKDLCMESSGKRWNADTIASSFSLLSQNGKGGMKGNFTINVKDKHYRFATAIRNFDLEIVRQYLWELINYGMFSAQLDATLAATGNFKHRDSINLQGRILLRDFHLGKTLNDNYIAFEKLVVGIDELNPGNRKFLFDSIILKRPFLKYEKYDSLNNVEMLFGRSGSNISDITSQDGRFNLVIELGRYLKKLTRNFFISHYRVNELIVDDGEFEFSDFSLSEQFTVSAKALTVRADSVDKSNKRVRVRINSMIKPYGNLSVMLRINPRDSGDFDMQYHLNKMSVSMFNPYLVSYTSFPLDRGSLELQGLWNVRNGEIKSVNHLVLLDPRISKRKANKGLHWMPLPLIMAFVRERGNVIDYQIPISGNLKDPRFHLHDIVTDLLKNIFVKPVTIPYGMALREAKNEIEDALTLTWDVRQQALRPHQAKFVKAIAKFLKKQPTSSIIAYFKEYELKEKEQILFFEAKKKYFLLKHGKKWHPLSEKDSLAVERMSIKEPSFMHSLKRGSGASDTVLFSIQDKSWNYVGSGKINSMYRQLLKNRSSEFLKWFIENGTRTRVTVHYSSDIIPFNGFSCFQIVYKGDIPESLRRAHKEMHEINDESLRRRYFKKKT
ncbi:MAG TPA: DUF748 domain-containing protein [Cyclobacteriaceae bacterium]|nr:DUF748 domain-containing protein [Cyclobacteriaceae bacterium]